jgi:ribose 5-phosphate isomerase B
VRISVSADELTGIADALCGELRRRGHEVICHGALAGARRWNDANVLALSLRATSSAELVEILDAWFAGEPISEAGDRNNVEHPKEIERS